MARVVSAGRRQSEPYERRRQRLIAAESRGAILDLGHAQLTNPYLPGQQVTEVDLAAPDEPSGYAEDLVGSVMDLADVVGTRRFDTVVAAELIEHLERPYDFLRSVRHGRIDAVATPVHVGRLQHLWQVELTDASTGKLAARGQVRMQVIDPERVAPA